MSKSINKKSNIRGTGMFAMPSKKDRLVRKESQQKHKKLFRNNWE